MKSCRSMLNHFKAEERSISDLLTRLENHAIHGRAWPARAALREIQKRVSTLVGLVAVAAAAEEAAEVAEKKIRRKAPKSDGK